MTGTGQDDVDRALAAVGAKSFVYRSFRRQSRPAEAPAADPAPASVEPPEVIPEPAPASEIVAAAEPAAPTIPLAEEPPPLPHTPPACAEDTTPVRTFEAAAPVFVTKPATPPPPPPTAAVTETSAAPASRSLPEPAPPSAQPSPQPSGDVDRQSVAQMFKLLTGRTEPSRRVEASRQPELRRRVEPPAPTSRNTPPPPRPDLPSLGFGLANHVSSRIATAEPRPGLRDIRPERPISADPTPGTPRPVTPSTDTPPVDEGLFRRL